MHSVHGQLQHDMMKPDKGFCGAAGTQCATGGFVGLTSIRAYIHSYITHVQLAATPR